MFNKRSDVDATLEEAVMYGDLAEVASALRNRANPKHADAHGNRAMHHFAARADMDGLQLMWDFTAEVNATNKKGETALDMAILNGGLRGILPQRKAIDFLLAAGARIESRHIAAAVGSDQYQIADYLQRIEDGTTPRPTFADVKSLDRITVVDGKDAPPLYLSSAVQDVQPQGTLDTPMLQKKDGNDCHARR